MTVLRDINEYLACEFGMDDVEVSDVSPFVLEERGTVGGNPVFAFRDGDVDCYALGGRRLRYMPVAGMLLADLQSQHAGAILIAEQDPVDLATSMPGAEDVPSTIERRKAIEEMCAAVKLEDAAILEGLFLRRSRVFLALVRARSEVVAVHSDGAKIAVAFEEASSWRRLAWAAATLLTRAHASATSDSNGSELP